MGAVKFFRAIDHLPPKHETVLVRGWGEGKKHYVWGFAEYRLETAMKRWVDKQIGLHGETLWFEPHEWAFLPKPHERSK